MLLSNVSKVRMSTVTILIQQSVRSSSQCNKARKEIQKRKEEIKLSVLVDDMIVHAENPKEP